MKYCKTKLIIYHINVVTFAEIEMTNPLTYSKYWLFLLTRLTRPWV